MTRPLSDIVDDRLYPLVEAAAFIASPHGGAIGPRALQKWCARGFAKAQRRRSGARRWYWFLLGSEVRRLACGEAVPLYSSSPSGMARPAGLSAEERTQLEAWGYDLTPAGMPAS